MMAVNGEPFWILESGFEYQVLRGIRLAEDNRKVVVHGETHSQLFENPVVLEIKRNVWQRACGDLLIFFHWGSDLVLISERLRAALEEINASGYELLPALVRSSQAKPLVEVPYSQLLVAGWGGIAPAESGVSKVSQNESGIWQYSYPTDCSKIVDLKQYDGSDFFRVWPMPGSTFITRRIKELLEKLQVKNCRFRRLEDNFGVHKSTLPGLAPAPLSLYFRPERAKELGEQHGIDWFNCR